MQYTQRVSTRRSDRQGGSSAAHVAAFVATGSTAASRRGGSTATVVARRKVVLPRPRLRQHGRPPPSALPPPTSPPPKQQRSTPDRTCPPRPVPLHSGSVRRQQQAAKPVPAGSTSVPAQPPVLLALRRSGGGGDGAPPARPPLPPPPPTRLGRAALPPLGTSPCLPQVLRQYRRALYRYPYSTQVPAAVEATGPQTRLRNLQASPAGGARAGWRPQRLRQQRPAGRIWLRRQAANAASAPPPLVLYCLQPRSRAHCLTALVTIT